MPKPPPPILLPQEDLNEITDAVENARRDVRYQVTDYPVELLVGKFRQEPEDEGDIYIPDYQRKLRWSEEAQSYFIESVLLRIPVPPIFFYDVKGQLEIVDGSQRVRTLANFVHDELELTPLEKLDALTGLKFSQLPPAIQKRLFNTPIRSFVLDEGTDESTRIELFRRLNTSGKTLHDAEIRKGAFRGKFLELIIECASSDLFKRLSPKITKASDAESERQELVTRFFVYSDLYKEFRHDVRRFLDQAVIKFNKSMNPKEIERKRNEFTEVMAFIEKHYPTGFYRNPKSATLPRVRFEAIAVGTCLALRAEPNLDPKDTSWIHSEDLYSLVRTDASNSGPRLRARIDYVRDRLLAG
ncbi:conserved hypothetical protein [Bradyrhizobium sp. ORS 375]|uniref:DUF262 domain-containing protein n=1 Tax=Bradyrhizobium sp. (strain ORS 375) TaxID=566679 RepID=UPI00024073F4|nr:DUF262 domain-containing protein [Bradyrhizobium sp. ORS 375]CCD90784.1 conserved hypothetical protein [Bradyrhizobium sp. ORS 375]